MKPFIFIFLLIIVSLTSCTVVQYVAVPVDYAPKTGFNRDTTTIVVVNKFTLDTTKIVNRKKRAVLRGGAYTSIATAVEQLKLLRGVNAINLADSINFVANTDSVKQLAQKYKANYVLTLDDFNADIVLDNVEYNGNSSTGYYNTVVRLGYTLWESNGIFRKPLGGIANDPQSEGEYNWFASLLIRPGVNGNGNSINSSARNATLDALKDYLPFTITNNRPLYTDDNMQLAVQQILKGNFKGAYDLLNPLIDNKDVRVASRAAYNLAVVYEAQGDIEGALETAKLSNSKQQNDYAAVLIAELMKE